MVERACNKQYLKHEFINDIVEPELEALNDLGIPLESYINLFYRTKKEYYCNNPMAGIIVDNGHVEVLEVFGMPVNFTKSFNELTYLDEMMLIDNNLTEFPPSLPENIKSIYLMCNKLKHIPQEIIKSLPMLEYISLQSNNITSIDAEIINQERLKMLDITKNPLSNRTRTDLLNALKNRQSDLFVLMI